MPLIKSATKEARNKNIAEMIHSGHSPMQAVAAGYNNQREAERSDHDERQKPKHMFEAMKYGQNLGE